MRNLFSAWDKWQLCHVNVSSSVISGSIWDIDKVMFFSNFRILSIILFCLMSFGLIFLQRTHAAKEKKLICKIIVNLLWTLSVNTGMRVCGFEGSLQTWILFLMKWLEIIWLFLLGLVAYISSCHLVILHVYILSAARLTTYLHAKGSHWATNLHIVAWRSSSYSISYVGHLRLWCDAECKVYFVIS